MKVEAIARFRDKETKKLRKIGDTLTVSEERGKKLILLGLAKEVKKEQVKEELPEEKMDNSN